MIYKSQLEKLTLMTGFVVQGHISHIVSVSHCNLDFFLPFLCKQGTTQNNFYGYQHYATNAVSLT